MVIDKLFEKACSEWVCYSEYELKEKNGVEYLTPAADSEIEIYNPLDKAEDLIVAVLNMGWLLCREGLTKFEQDMLLVNFAQNYGLLGFMTALPLNANFMEQDKVYFWPHSLFGASEMASKEYMDFFQPFGIKDGQPKGFTLPPALVTGRALEFEFVFSRNYSEETEWIVKFFKEFYLHFSACKAYDRTDNPALKSACADTVSGFMEYGLGFRMSMEDKPTMVWDFNSLKQMIETVYAVLVSKTETPLRMCKHCGKAFYATHGRSEFCDTKCRNQYNVYKYRAKEKQ